MGSLTDVVRQLRRERERAQKEVHRIDGALAALGNLSVNGTRPRRTLSSAGRKAISLAQKERWAKQKAGKPKRTMSAEGKKRIAAAARARWVKFRTAKKKAA